MRTSLTITALLLLGTGLGRAAEPDAVFDFKALTATPLNPKTLKSTEKDGIVTEEVMFHSEMDGAKSVDIFALFSYPTGAKKLPAFVWNQGGLYQASPYWTTFGARRGYAALCIDFPLPGYRSTGGYPISSGLELGDDPRKAPIYHGAVALLKAVSYLESRPEVDRERIGMAGSSWGGFYTTLMIGIDPRLKAGTCMFGSGGLQLGNNWWDTRGWDARRDEAFRRRWRTTLDPAWRLANRKTPIAWFTGTNDVFYWMPAVMQSYERAAGPKHLSLLPNWNHALTPQLDEQVFAWLDCHLQGKPAFLTVTPIEIGKEKRPVARWTFDGPRKAASAELILSYGDAGNWSGRYWKTLPATIKDRSCVAELPASALPYFISGAVLDADGGRYSTPLLRIDPAKVGLQDAAAVPDYDGSSEWGSFGESQVNYLRLHGLPVPALSKEAKDGKQSAIVKGGKLTLPQMLCTLGIAHRLTCNLKADKPVEVVVQVAGRFDGKPVVEEKTFKVGSEWTAVSVEFVPLVALTAGVQATITAPKEAVVLVDGVRFRPVRGKP